MVVTVLVVTLVLVVVAGIPLSVFAGGLGCDRTGEWYVIESEKKGIVQLVVGG